MNSETYYSMIQILSDPGLTLPMNSHNNSSVHLEEDEEDQSENQINFKMSVDYIPQIVEKLGPHRTANELVPFIFSFSTYFEEEIINTLESFSKINMSAFQKKDCVDFFINFSTVFTRDSHKIRIAVAVLRR